MSCMNLPADIQALMRDVDAADRTADDLATSVSEEEFFWQPDGGTRWSIAHCLVHLTTSAIVYGGAVRAGVDAARARGLARQGPVKLAFFGRKFVEHLEPPATRRTKAPAKIQPKVSGTRDEILRAYHASHDEIRRLFADAATIDTNRATFPNPFVPLIRVSVSTGLHVITSHERRHLWQAAEVKKALRASSSVDRRP